MVDGIAHKVHKGLIDALDDFPIGFNCLAFREEIDRLAQSRRRLADKSRKAPEGLADRDHPRARHRGIERSHEPIDLRVALDQSSCGN